MRVLRTLQNGLLLRRVLRTLAGLETRLDEQNKLLARLADHLAPVPPPAEDLAHQTSVDFLNQVEKGEVEDYVIKTMLSTGKVPTEEEILQHLADEATESLIEHRKGQSL